MASIQDSAAATPAEQPENTAAAQRAWLKRYPDWVSPSLDYGEDTVLTGYLENVRKHPTRPVTTFFGNTTNYKELHEHVLSAAAGLKSLGVQQGDKVALIMPNCPQHIVAYLATLYVGATVVEHNPLYTAHELRHPFQDHGAKVAIAWDKTVETLQQVAMHAPLEKIIAVNMLEDLPWFMRQLLKLPIPALRAARSKMHSSVSASEDPADSEVLSFSDLLNSQLGGTGTKLEPTPVTAKDPAVIMYTSGTTGNPKGAQLTHGSLVANVKQGIAWVPELGKEREVALAVLPMFHAYGLTIVTNLSLTIGAELVMIPSPEIPLIMKAMKRNRPTWVPGVPTLYEKIVATAEESGAELSGIKFAFCGASTLPVSLVEKWERLTGGRLVEGYGLTETSPIIVGNPMDGNRRPGYVGIPFPDTEIAVVDPNDPTVLVADGTEGEVIARGPQVFGGYLNLAEATENSFTAGPKVLNDASLAPKSARVGEPWYRTGDVGVMEEDGFLRLVARIKEVIITGGFNVYPAEVEEVLTDYSDITAATVVGLPKSDGSELVVAAITLDEYARLDTEAIRSHCKRNLTGYKVPRAYFHLDELPQDQMGKVRRRDVQKLLLERLEQRGESVDSLIKKRR